MEIFTIGFPTAFSANNLLYCGGGVFLGTLVGVIPGIGALAAVSLLLPVSYYLDPTTAVIMLAGVYYGAEYGGSTASILLNLPGTPSNAITCLDGYPMAQNGRAGVALFMTTIASFVGGTLGIILLMVLTPTIISIAIAFGPGEYFAVVLLGLLASAGVTQGSMMKGVAMVLLGLLLASVGHELHSGMSRYDFGIIELFDGVSLITLAMGLFGVAEIISSVNTQGERRFHGKISLRSMIPTREDMRRSWKPMLRGTSLGSLFGPLPGTGPGIAAFLGYAWEKRLSRTPERFGKGAIEGIASPESANNAAVQTAFIPTLAMGIPGTATMAVMLGALMTHGVIPGPNLVNEHPELFWGLIASFWIGNALLLVLNIPMIGIWVRILQIPYRYLYPAVLALVCVGVYSINNAVFDIWMVLFFGAGGYGMWLLDFEPAPLLIGFFLGTLMEENFRRAMLLARGDFSQLLLSPVSGSLLALAAVIAVWAVYSALRSRRQETLNITESE